MVKGTLLYFFLIFSLIPSFGQVSNIGIPIITNYPKEEYQAATQSWSICQSKSGKVFFANNEGLLSFDGQLWQVNPLPNQTIARSVSIDDKDRIYIGGQDEIGRFEAGENGRLVFKSLKSLIPQEYQSFEDVWQIELLNDQVFFRTSNRIYHLQDSVFKVLTTNSFFSFLAKIDSQILVQDERGILVYKNDQWQLLEGSQLFGDKIIKGISSRKGIGILIHTFKNGSFTLSEGKVTSWGEETRDFFKKNRITCSITLPNGRIALGTSLAGIIVLAEDGTPVHLINKQAGLQTNNVLCAFRDQSGSIWLGLNNGIDYVETSSPFSLINPDGDLKDAGYAINIFKDRIYFGTSNGLYSSLWKEHFDPFKKAQYESINGTSGHVWGLNSIKDELLLAHHEGAFTIESTNASNISRTTGAWQFVELKKHPGFMISGNYNGVHLYQKINGKWNYVKKLNGLDESCRVMADDDDGNIWISHPYRGIYRLIFPQTPDSMEVSVFGADNGLPFDNFNSVYRIRNQILAATANGVYQYNPQKMAFEPNITLNKILGDDVWVKLLKEDYDGNVWFVVDNEVGLLKINQVGLETQIERIDYPELKGKLFQGHEFLYPYDRRNIFFASESGFIHFDPEYPASRDTILYCLLNQINMISGKDSLVFGGSFSQNEAFSEKGSDIPIFHYKENAFRFSFTSTQFSKNGYVEFQYKLNGFEDEWNPWTKNTSKEFTNLNPGNYDFWVQARNHHGKQSEIITYKFKINPPWYASNLSKAIYILLIVLSLAGIFWIPRSRFKRETAELKTIMTQEREAQNQTISKIKNEQLKEEVRHKNQELASTTMHLVQKNEILSKIRIELEKIREKADGDTINERIKKLIKLIENDQKIDKDWEQFAFHFDQVHRDFLKRLSHDFPQLSPTDHRLCAYLRMNLSSKEIAPIMNISVRGVETGRYRLRKKMDLEKDVNLNEFMMRF